MSDVFKDAYNAGRGDGDMPETGYLARDDARHVIDAYFQGVTEKQEREAREHGYGRRLTTLEDVEQWADALRNTDHGSVAEFIAVQLAAVMNSDTTLSAIMAGRGDRNKSSFVTEFSDMNFIERYRVTVERAD